jgi:hypothetical protein
MPEGLSFTFELRPRVMARWTIACFSSRSSAMIFFFARISFDV